MTRPLFLRALAGEPVERFPVWMMRQAGRYLPGYRAVRAKTSFLDLCRNPALAAEVSLEPVARFDVDAAIVFADILLTADAMGAPVHFDDGGPKLSAPIRRAGDVAILHAPDAARVRPTMEAISRIRAALPPSKAVIGFSAAPFTLCAYLIEGGTSRDFNAVRRLLAEDRGTFTALLDRATEALIPYLKDQAAAGADALMLFDTWGALLGADLAAAYVKVGHKVRLQGNFDPAGLYAPPSAIEAAVARMLDAVPAGRPHLVNLGHGILPDVPVEHAAAFVRAAQAYRVRGARP
jgi:uroporphyrinogen decarboxylase